MKETARAAVSRCRACGARVTARQNFCGRCGAALQPDASGVPAHLQYRIQNARVALEAERKYVTILFADIAGSTALIDDLDPEQAAMILDPVLQAMTAVVHSHGGIVTRIQGDGIMAIFGAPLAQEDHAARACRSALEIRALQEDPRIATRVGLHSGEVVLRIVRNDTSVEYDAVGVHVHLAARMEQTARPGSILLTDATYRLISGLFTTQPLGRLPIKRGPGRDIEAFELLGSQDWRGRWHARGPGDSGTFVNRHAEMAALHEAAGAVMAGRGQIAAITGQAGTGKSRLVHEFAEQLATSGWQVFEAPAGDEQRSSSYLPFASLLRDWCGAEPDDPHDQVIQRIGNRLAELRSDGKALLAPVAALLDIPTGDADWVQLSPSLRRRRIAEAMVSLLRDLAQRRKLLLLIEDAHWLDRESEALLERLVDELPDIGMLLVATYRPEHRERWDRSGGYRRIDVRPLSGAESRLLLDARLGPDPSLDPVKEQLAERTQGIPLFLEEMIRTLNETAVVAGKPGQYRLAGTVQRLQVPDTVQSVLASRVDRLPPRRKELLQVAAAIGGEFSLPLLARVLDRPALDLAADLTALKAAEFIVARGGKAALRFGFRHVLMEEVTYGSLLGSRRLHIHRQIVQAIEALYAHQIDQQAEALAWHAAKGELWRS